MPRGKLLAFGQRAHQIRHEYLPWKPGLLFTSRFCTLPNLRKADGARESERESRDELAVARLHIQRRIADGSKSRRRGSARQTDVSARSDGAVGATPRALRTGGGRIVQVGSVEDVE